MTAPPARMLPSGSRARRPRGPARRRAVAGTQLRVKPWPALNQRQSKSVSAWGPYSHTGIGMQVRLLGPVDVMVHDESRPVHGLRRKAVLAVLALHGGEIVSTDQLADAVW